ncbi:DUF4145 domain-containing protein [Ekhidna sp.]
MYIDFHKYNYELVPSQKVDQFKQRDQESYKSLLRRWFDENLDEIVDRKWEIEEIHYLKNISDFIKLVREGEQLFEFGFYTGCISLIGVASEDFCRYISGQLGKPEYENLTQFNRLKNLKSDGLISNATYSLLDSIRKIRNDCLHYNQNFKQKDISELRSDAIKVLNNIKNTLKRMLGESEVDFQSNLTTVISEIGSNEGTRNKDEIAIKVKNAISHLLNFPVAFDPNSKFQIRTSVFEILEIDADYDEISLKDLISEIPVIVEFPKKEREYYQDKELNTRDKVSATLISMIDQNGLTGEWTIIDINKI